MSLLATSEEQFKELLAQLIARANKALSMEQPVPPMSLLLRASGAVDVAVGVADSPEELGQVLSAMQAALQQNVSKGGVLATCVAYCESAAGVLVALLENHENDCAEVRIPFASGPAARLNTDALQVEDGSVYVFPVVGDAAG